tara:strand:+ start:742 stop:1107 length:366 start_codon:yes stop_codon:yes gene_type:complete
MKHIKLFENESSQIGPLIKLQRVSREAAVLPNWKDGIKLIQSHIFENQNDLAEAMSFYNMWNPANLKRKLKLTDLLYSFFGKFENEIRSSFLKDKDYNKESDVDLPTDNIDDNDDDFELDI